MDAVRKLATVEKDGQLVVRGLPYKKGDQLEVIVMKPKLRRRGMTASELLSSPIVGLWADRDDIVDSSAFARKLRDNAQNRNVPE